MFKMTEYVQRDSMASRMYQKEISKRGFPLNAQFKGHDSVKNANPK